MNRNLYYNTIFNMILRYFKTGLLFGWLLIACIPAYEDGVLYHDWNRIKEREKEQCQIQLIILSQILMRECSNQDSSSGSDCWSQAWQLINPDLCQWYLIRKNIYFIETKQFQSKNIFWTLLFFISFMEYFLLMLHYLHITDIFLIIFMAKKYWMVKKDIEFAIMVIALTCLDSTKANEYEQQKYMLQMPPPHKSRQLSW